MMIWHTLYVPQCERRIAQSLGHEDVVLFEGTLPESGVQTLALTRDMEDVSNILRILRGSTSKGCRLQVFARAGFRRWFYDATVDADQLPTWIRQRLTPPAKQLFKLPFDKKHEAKAAGACWDRDRSAWTLPLGVKPPDSMLQYAVAAEAHGANPSL